MGSAAHGYPIPGVGSARCYLDSVSEVLGNGKDIAQLAFADRVAPALLLTLLVLKPAATILCLGSGAPGGLFTPTLILGALLGGVLGHAWFWPGVPFGEFSILGAAAMLAATTQGPISAVVLVMDLTGRDRIVYRSVVARRGHRHTRRANH